MNELGIDDISKYLLHVFHDHSKKILSDISQKYSINKEELFSNYLNSDLLKNNTCNVKKKKKKLYLIARKPYVWPENKTVINVQDVGKIT